MKIKKLNLNEEGLLRFFGSLEAKIMNIVWEKEKVTIKQVHQILDEREPISLNAVMTVMIRLAEKGHLRKETSGAGRNRLTYFYPAQGKEQFIKEQTEYITDGLIDDFGSLVVNHFIDRLDKVDPSLINKLQQKINDLKRSEE